MGGRREGFRSTDFYEGGAKRYVGRDPKEKALKIDKKASSINIFT